MSNSLTVREKEHWKDRIAARIDKRIDALGAEQGGFMKRVEQKARDRAQESAGILKMQHKIDKSIKDDNALNEKRVALLDEVDKKKRAIDNRVQPRLEKLQQEQAELEQQMRKLRDNATRKKRLLDERAEPGIDRIREQQDALENSRTQIYRKMLAKLDGVSLREIEEEPYSPEWKIERGLQSQTSVEVDKLLAESTRGRQILALRSEKENLLDTVWLATSGKQMKELWEKVDSLLGGTQTKLQHDAAAILPVEEE